MGLMVLLAGLFLGWSMFLRRRNAQKAEYWKNLQSRWLPMLQQTLERQLMPEVLWEQVQPDEELYFVDFLYQQVKSLKLAEKQLDNPHYRMLMQLAEPYLQPLVRRLNSRDLELRARAVETLGKLAPFTYQAELFEALKDPSQLVAFAAFRALLFLKRPEHFLALIKIYSRFQTFQPHYLGRLLSQLPPEPLAATLAYQALNEHAELWKRLVALHVLEAWPNQPQIVVDLHQEALSEQTPEILRMMLLRVLIAWQAESALKPVILQFVAAEQPLLRAYGMYALSRIHLPGREDLLELGLTDSNRQVAIEAANAFELLEAAPERLQSQPLEMLLNQLPYDLLATV